MMTGRINYDLATAAFYSALDFLLCWDDIVDEVENEEVLTPEEVQESLHHYRMEILEYVRQFCGFVVYQVATNTGMKLAKHAKSVQELLPSTVFTEDSEDKAIAWQKWSQVISAVDKLHESPDLLRTYGKEEFTSLLRQIAEVAEVLINISLNLEELECDD